MANEVTTEELESRLIDILGERGVILKKLDHSPSQTDHDKWHIEIPSADVTFVVWSSEWGGVKIDMGGQEVYNDCYSGSPQVADSETLDELSEESSE